MVGAVERHALLAAVPHRATGLARRGDLDSTTETVVRERGLGSIRMADPHELAEAVPPVLRALSGAEIGVGGSIAREVVLVVGVLVAYLTWMFERRGSHRKRFGMSAGELTPMAYREMLKAKKEAA